MAIIRKKDLRKLDEREIDKRTADMRLELAKQKASIKIGATVTSPGRTRELRKAIARILTIKNERVLKKREAKEGESGRKPASGVNRLQSKE